MTPNLPLLAWTPDGDPFAAGAMANVENLIPTERGYAPDFELAEGSIYSQSLGTACYGAALVEQFGDQLDTLLLGTRDKIYAAVGGALIDVTRSTPGYGDANSVHDDGWRFASFGSDALAVSRANQLQRSASPRSGTRFANVSGAPAASTMAVTNNFVMLGDVIDQATTATFSYPDGYWTCALQNVNSWTPDVATFASRGRLMQTPGRIVRLMAYGADILAFKPTSIIRGTFTGDPAVPWSWQVVSSSVGLVSHGAVAEAESVLYFVAHSGVYAYNGGQVSRVDSAPWDFFKSRVSITGSQPDFYGNTRVLAQWDSVRRVVRFYYADRSQIESSWIHTRGLAFHPATNRWGAFSANVAAVATADYESVPTVYDAARLRPRVPLAISADTNRIVAYRGPPAASSYTTGIVGDDERLTVLTGVRARVTGAPVSPICLPRYRMTLDDLTTPWTIGDAVLRTADGRYDFSHSARWHQLEFRTAAGGMYELYGFRVEVPPAGKR